MSQNKGHSNLTKENSILLERVNALENKVREIDQITERLNTLEIPLKPSDDLEIIVLKAIRDNENITYNKLERLTGMSNATVLKKRDNLERKGLIRYDKPVRKGRKVHHNITEIEKVNDYIKLNSGVEK